MNRFIFITATKHLSIWSHFKAANTTHAGAPSHWHMMADGSTTRNTKMVSFLNTKLISPPDFTSPKRHAA